jgi:hypothetical protein
MLVSAGGTSRVRRLLLCPLVLCSPCVIHAVPKKSLVAFKELYSHPYFLTLVFASIQREFLEDPWLGGGTMEILA